MNIGENSYKVRKEYMSMIKIGVVLPTYNRPHLLEKALKSIQGQDYSEWITVVVNDASNTDYSSVEKLFSGDSRIVFRENIKNSGVNTTINNGFDEILKYDVDYITFLDDDDIFAPDYFRKGIEMIEKYPKFGWFMSNNFGEHKKSTRDIEKICTFDWIDDYIYKKFRGDKAHMISREVLSGVRMDQRFRSSHRWPFFIDLAEKTNILAFPHDSIKKTYLEDGITKIKKEKFKNVLEIHDKYYKHLYVIKKRPFCGSAYKYFLLELLKTPQRYIKYIFSK